MAEASPNDETTPIDVPALERRIMGLEQTLADEHQGRLRALADFENYRRRIEREAGAARRAGRSDALRPVLGILDNLERALATGSTDLVFLRGVEAITEQLRRMLKGLGAEPIPGLGTSFDPRLHEAVGTVPGAAQSPGTVVAELRRGYLLDGEVLRPSQVLVARSAADIEEQGRDDLSMADDQRESGS